MGLHQSSELVQEDTFTGDVEVYCAGKASTYGCKPIGTVSFALVIKCLPGATQSGNFDLKWLRIAALLGVELCVQSHLSSSSLAAVS